MLVGPALIAQAQAVQTPALRAGALESTHRIDGLLDEPAWATAEVIDVFTQADPREGEPASARTVVRVLAGPKALRHRHRLRTAAWCRRGELQCAPPGTAQKRRLYTQLTWWFGGFYGGELDQYQWTGAWNPTALVTVEFSGQRNVGRLPEGRFVQTLVGNRLRINMSPNLSISSYVQYDTDSDSIGVNTRLRWTFRPEAELFVVYNHNGGRSSTAGGSSRISW